MAAVIFCKNHPPSWVASRLHTFTDKVLSLESASLKKRAADLVGRILAQFDGIADAVCIEKGEICRNRLLA